MGQQPFSHDVTLGQPLPTNTLESLRALDMAGVEIAAHTRTHADLGKIHDEETLVDEVLTAAKELEAAIGRKVRYFAFPFGQYPNLNPRVFSMLRAAGFLGVCSAYGGWNSVGSDEFHLQRIHGDPCFSRMINWMTYDPRLEKVLRYEESNPGITETETPKRPLPASAGVGLPVSTKIENPLPFQQPTRPSC
jgi:peptidoglycan/xylan/chitin deacetylase (PgdA/CDA1 family)